MYRLYSTHFIPGKTKYRTSVCEKQRFSQNIYIYWRVMGESLTASVKLQLCEKGSFKKENLKPMTSHLKVCVSITFILYLRFCHFNHERYIWLSVLLIMTLTSELIKRSILTISYPPVILLCNGHTCTHGPLPPWHMSWPNLPLWQNDKTHFLWYGSFSRTVGLL